MNALKVLLVFVFLILIPASFVNAGSVQNQEYSQISTSFILTKTVKCDEVKAKFEVYAEGDNYSMALKRLTKINNEFINFLKRTFSAKEVQTSNAYGYSKTAIIYVSVKSKKLSGISSALRYIANKNFQYKTGIKPVYIRFIVSNKLKDKIKNQLFIEALNKATAKLTVVNSILSNGYKIGSLDIETNAPYPILYERNTFRALYKSSSASNQASNNIQTSPGSVTLKVKVRLKMIKKLD